MNKDNQELQVCNAHLIASNILQEFKNKNVQIDDAIAAITSLFIGLCRHSMSKSTFENYLISIENTFNKTKE